MELKEIKLPSGKMAKVRKAKGRDLLKAQRVAQRQDELSYALLAEITEIDGQRMVYEDFMDLDLEDILILQEEIPLGK